MDEHRSLSDVFSNSLYRAIPELCDETLRLEDGTEFNVHSAQLSKHSKFFRALFSIGAEDQSCVFIHEIDPNTLERILIYIYTGCIYLNTENMIQLLIASDYLLIDPLMEKCRKFVLRNISVENCLILLITAWRIRRLAILNKCYRFVQLHFEQALQQSMDVACDLPLRVLKSFLKNKSVNVSGECVIWSLIEAWVEKEPSTRLSTVPELLNYLSVSEVDEYLASEIISSPLVQESEDSINLNSTKSNFTGKDKLVQYIRRHNEVPCMEGERHPRRSFFISHGFDHRDGVELFVTYDDRFDVWRKVGETTFNPLSLFKINERIYIFDAGDKNGERDSEGVFAYDLLSDKTIPIAQMPLKACHITEASGELYSLGDIDNNETTVVQKYDPVSDTWIPTKPMQSMVVEETVDMDGRIYAIGTAEGYPVGMLMQVYDPVDDRWTSVTGPNIRRCLMSAVVYQDSMYLIGGFFEDGEYSRDVEVYDPVKDAWGSFPELPFDYDAPMAMVLEETLFVYSYLEPSIVGYWDQERRKWRCVQDNSPLMELHLYCFCALDDPEILREVVRKNRLPDVEWVETPLVSITP